MKPFNLQEALAGEPVKLRKGSKAYVLAKIPDNFKYVEGKEVPYPLMGIVMDKDGYISNSHMCWTLKGGCYFTNEPLHNDIIGMWEEPIKFEDLPKPFIPKHHEVYFIISPTDTKPEKYFANDLDHPSIQNGNCFKTKEDAQKWINFMKSMKE